MVSDPRHILRIGIASGIALVLIMAAYITSGPVPFLAKLKVADAESSEALLKAYAAKDSDEDGLPDWEESLYGTDPNDPESVQKGLKDGDAIAQGLVKPKFQSQTATTTESRAIYIPGDAPASDSLTDQFSRAFFESYMQSGGATGAMTEDDQQTLITSLLDDFGKKAATILLSPYTAVSVHTSNTASVLDYAGKVEAILRANDVKQGEAEPLALMEALLEKNDQTALPKLQRLAASYKSITKDLLALPVPLTLRDSHLSLVQGFDTLARATDIVSSYQKDPIAVMGSLAVYQPASQQVIDAFSAIATSVLATGEPEPGAPGALIVNFARSQQTP